MLARKCDFCGGFYEHYDCKDKGNAIITVTRDLDDCCYEHDLYDLCPECMCKVLVMIRNN